MLPMIDEQLKLELKSIDVKSLVFTPKTDISTFELAQALTVLVPYRNDGGMSLTVEEAFNRLPPEVQRHFQYTMVQR
jgi:hypothetical protein